MNHKARQPRMFGEEDLPLFSGTAPRGEVEVFDPKPMPDVKQDSFIETEEVEQ